MSRVLSGSDSFSTQIRAYEKLWIREQSSRSSETAESGPSVGHLDHVLGGEVKRSRDWRRKEGGVAVLAWRLLGLPELRCGVVVSLHTATSASL